MNTDTCSTLPAFGFESVVCTDAGSTHFALVLVAVVFASIIRSKPLVVFLNWERRAYFDSLFGSCELTQLFGRLIHLQAGDDS